LTDLPVWKARDAAIAWTVQPAGNPALIVMPNLNMCGAVALRSGLFGELAITARYDRKQNSRNQDSH